MRVLSITFITHKPRFFLFSPPLLPHRYFVHKKCPLTSSFYSELQNILNSSSNWNVQIWIFKTPFYPLYTCSLIKYSTLSHYCIRRSMNGKHNRTIVIHNPLILSVTDKTKGDFRSLLKTSSSCFIIVYSRSPSARVYIQW